MSTTTHSRRLLLDVLDQLPVTDRVFHALKQALPLVEELIVPISRLAPPAGRILIVGPNSLLATAVRQLGYEVELWCVPHGALIEDLNPLVTRTAPLDELLADDDSGPRFDLIVLPYILEAAREEPATVLSRLRNWLNPQGHILLASASAGRLRYRFRGARGRFQLWPSYDEASPIGVSWPRLPLNRLLDQGQLHHGAQQAGFHVEDMSLIMDAKPTVAADAKGIVDWLVAETFYTLRKTVPGMQNCLLATLRPFSAPDTARHTESGYTEYPFVTLLVSATSPARAERLLSSLEDQTYPLDRMEVILLHSSADGFDRLAAHQRKFPVRLQPFDPHDGPAAANAGLRLASGEVVAFTDDHCLIPPAWVESGVAATGRWTAAATGEVLAEGNGLHPLLALPGAQGTRTDDPERGLFPASNSFYLKDALVEVGGFNESLQAAGAVWGWESEAAYRLASAGYHTAFEETLFVSREYPAPAGWSWIRSEYRRAKQIPEGVRLVPALRRTQLVQRVFATRRTRAFDLLVLGLLLARIRRRRAYALLAIPWVKEAAAMFNLWQPDEWRESATNLSKLSGRHVVWLAGLAVGSVKSKRLVL